MSVTAHEWIENKDEYEAVFQCHNNLGEWQKDAHVRAFQTFDWNDASVNTDELTFAHFPSGVFIKYDGGTVAIMMGDSPLPLALPDLFSVLFNLGWRFADVHHPAHTMNALLDEIGRAIPAHMSLDIHPAKDSTQNFTLDDAASLISHGASALSEGKVDGNEVLIIGELESMTPSESSPDNLKYHITKHPYVLSDDVDDHEKDFPKTGQLNIISSLEVIQKSASVEQLLSINDSNASDGLNQSALQQLTDKYSRIQAELVIENENLRDELVLVNDRLAVEKELAQRSKIAQDEKNSLRSVPDEVAAMADLLRDMALSYASSSRYRLLTAKNEHDDLLFETYADIALPEKINKIEIIKSEKNQVLVADVNDVVGNFIVQLQRLGVTV